MLVAVTTRPMIRACIPAPGGEFPLSPSAMIVQVSTALPSSSEKNAVDTRTQSRGCVYMLTPVEVGSSAPSSRYKTLSRWTAKASSAPQKAPRICTRMYWGTRRQGKPRKMVSVMIRAGLRKAPLLPPEM